MKSVGVKLKKGVHKVYSRAWLLVNHRPDSFNKAWQFFKPKLGSYFNLLDVGGLLNYFVMQL
jgi:hypothetical protein